MKIYLAMIPVMAATYWLQKNPLWVCIEDSRTTQVSEGLVMYAVDVFGLESKAKAEESLVEIPLLLPASLFALNIVNWYTVMIEILMIDIILCILHECYSWLLHKQVYF